MSTFILYLSQRDLKESLVNGIVVVFAFFMFPLPSINRLWSFSRLSSVHVGK